MALSATSSLFLNTTRNGGSTTSLGSAFQYLCTPSVEKFLLMSEPPLVQFNSVSIHPAVGCLGEEAETHLARASFQAIVESDKVNPEPPFLQAK